MPIYKRKRKNKTLYFGKFSYLDELGKSRQINTKYFNTKHEAEEAELKLRLKIKDNKTHEKLTFRECFMDYEEHQKDIVKYSTWSKYKELYKHIDEPLGKIQMSSLTLAKYGEFKNLINNKKLSLSRKNRIHKFILTLCSYANKMYGIKCDAPSRLGGFINPNERKKEMKFFTYEEFRSFIKEFDNNQIYRALFKTLYFMGLRIGEANGLRWCDIDFSNQTMHIRNTVNVKIKGQDYLLTPPKTKGSDRVLPIESEVLEELKALYAYHQSVEGFNSDFFCFGGHLPLSDSTITANKDRAIKLTGVKKIRIHDFRHSCASYYIHLGAQPILISKLLGHSKISITLDIYSHLYPNQLNEIMEISKQFKNNKF